MRIGGLQKCSLIDYPDNISCVIFTQGCNFRCPYCHNRELVLPEHFQDTIPQEEVLDLLLRRRQYLDGVVITGGEPTEQEDLLSFLVKVKSMGYLLKLDTNGSRPHIIRAVIQQKLVDYIAMDVKTSFEKYQKAIGINFPVELIQESIELIKDSSITHEFRTTVVQPFCKYADVCKISSILKGEKTYRLQPFRRSSKIIYPNIEEIDQFSNEEIELWKEKL
ncbi:MAG: anaerobic ribonucleoside-triphosphate reductase activating protein [Candidatus Omnitrophica bacterium]|nr:anaerobic ribonucleoside-triphosphate reductase activating protein [Candidatus Omnitrophota bacterium]MCA9407106.1 anaerobic ribonucleoside-triphosphate reductase activating protein [Candidatus Omnitrophota bacterium]